MAMMEQCCIFIRYANAIACDLDKTDQQIVMYKYNQIWWLNHNIIMMIDKLFLQILMCYLSQFTSKS